MQSASLPLPILVIGAILVWALINSRRRRASNRRSGELVAPIRGASPGAVMRFRNPSNGYVEEISSPGLWCLLFGCFYLAYKGVWMAAVMAAGLALITLGLSWLIFPFFARRLVEASYLQKGWIPVDALERGGRVQQATETKTCPSCAEEIKVAAKICRFCQYRFSDSESGVAA